MSVKPAATKAPEALLQPALARLDEVFVAKTGEALLRDNRVVPDLLAKAHRFRAAEADGLEALAKDLNSLITERIKIDVLRRHASPPKGENWRELKSLEKVVAAAIGEADAHSLMGPMFGMNDLRNVASHIGGSDREDAMKRARIDLSAPVTGQGRQLLAAVVETLDAISSAAENLPK